MPATRAVFLSYASQDVAAAQRICEALRAAGVEVWFDQSELVGGDQWDAKIRRQIGSCALFVPLISAATQARLEGYFRLEWKLAAQRTYTMADEKAFLLPVWIDDTGELEAKVPAEFKAVQWSRLPGGETPAKFCERVKSLLNGAGVPDGGAARVAPMRPAPASAPRGGWQKPAIVGALILAVLAGIWGLRRPGPASLPAKEPADTKLGTVRYLQPQPVIVGPESNEWPTPSPDGKTLAFVRLVNGYRQVFLKSLAGDGPARQLTDDESDHIEPRWTPDGKDVLYCRPTNGHPPGIRPSDVWGGYYSPQALDVWIRNLASNQARVLLEKACGARFNRQGVIAYSRYVEGSSRIWTCDRNGNERRLVTEDPDKVEHFEPDWSPDGRHIVYRRMQGKTSALAVVDLETRKSAILTDAYYLSEPTWSPSGQYIYVSANLASGFNLWRLPLTDAATRAGPFEPVTFGIGRDLHPAFSTDGHRLFYSIVTWNSDLWALPMNLETGKPAGDPFPVIESSREDTRGDWASDGRRIVFTSDRGGHMNLYVAAFDPEKRAAGNAVQLTFGPGGDYQASWSPKGNQIAFFSRRSGNEDIWLVNMDDNGAAAGPPRQLTTSSSADINPVFSPDGLHIAFMSDRTGKNLPYVMNPDGSGQRALAEIRATGHYMRWLDANTLVFSLGGGMYMQTKLDGGEPQALNPAPTGISSSHLTMSPDHRFFADNNHINLQLWDRKTSRVEPNLYTFLDKNIGVDYTVWSPDGRYLLFDRNNPQGGDIYALENPE